MPRHAQEGLPPLPTGGLFVGAETDKVGESPTAAVVALPAGADGDVLTVAEGAPTWAAPSPSGGSSGAIEAVYHFDDAGFTLGTGVTMSGVHVGCYVQGGRVYLFGRLEVDHTTGAAALGGGAPLVTFPAELAAPTNEGNNDSNMQVWLANSSAVDLLYMSGNELWYQDWVASGSQDETLQFIDASYPLASAAA